MLVAAGVSLLALALVVVALPAGRAVGGPTRPPEPVRWGDVLQPRLWSVYLLHFTALFLWTGVRGTLWPTLAAAEGRLSVEAIGIALGACSLLSLGALHAAGIAGDRYGKRPVIALGLLAAGLGVGLLAASADPRLLVAALALQDLGQGFMAANASALLADVLRGPGIALATGVMRVTADLGGLTGPLVLGGTAGWLGYAVTALLAAAVPLANLVLLGGLASGAVRKRRRDPASVTMRL
jgi:MFS family permease